MDNDAKQLHLHAGFIYGRDATCGTKIDYRSEATANASAEAMMGKGSKELEGYPCYWCQGWHIGRKMTEEEIAQMREELTLGP